MNKENSKPICYTIIIRAKLGQSEAEARQTIQDHLRDLKDYELVDMWQRHK